MIQARYGWPGHFDVIREKSSRKVANKETLFISTLMQSMLITIPGLDHQNQRNSISHLLAWAFEEEEEEFELLSGSLRIPPVEEVDALRDEAPESDKDIVKAKLIKNKFQQSKAIQGPF